MFEQLYQSTLLTLGLLTTLANAQVTPQPNIVVIMADDLGWRDLHCYGNERIDTPNIDRLADEGMRFTEAYAAAPVCSPTRAAMMTGLSPARLHLTNHAPGHANGFSLEGTRLQEAEWVRNLDLSYVTLAERLQEAGYATAHIGKWHLSYVAKDDAGGVTELMLRPEAQGFDVNIGGCFRGGPPSYFAPYGIPALEAHQPGEYLPERLADEAIHFIDAHRSGPFFVSWWPYSVHYPLEAAPELIEKYRARPGVPDPVFAAMIEAMDRSIGRFLTHLQEVNLHNETIVIFKSDNGSYNGDNRPLRGSKGWLYEGGIRIPWIVRWPGVIQPGSVCHEPVISMDCFPTLLEVAGIELDENQPMDGMSLLPLFRQQGGFERASLYFHYPNYAFHKQNRLASAIRTGKYKLIHNYDDDSLELYDLTTDIGESQNLAEELTQVAESMHQDLVKWLKRSAARMPQMK